MTAFLSILIKVGIGTVCLGLLALYSIDRTKRKYNRIKNKYSEGCREIVDWMIEHETNIFNDDSQIDCDLPEIPEQMKNKITKHKTELENLFKKLA